MWLNGILKELLSRLSVFSGSCTPSLFFFFLADVRFACHIVLRGRADSMRSGAAVRGPSTTLLQLSAAPLKGLAFDAAPPHSMGAKKWKWKPSPLEENASARTSVPTAAAA